MKTLQWMLAGVAVGVIVVAIRELRYRSLESAAPESMADVPEPVLGYDGMDQETILEWLPEADLDPEQLEDIGRYEEATRAREPVLALIDDLLD